jgi:rhamnose transport system substrate-binding protein
MAVALGRNPESATGGEGMTSSSPYRRLLASLVIAALALFAAACGETKNDSSTTSGGSSSQAASGDGAANPSAPIKQGLKMVSIPKQLGNPYEEFEHSGVVEAAKELGGNDRIQGSTDAGASSQVPIINSIVQQKPDAIIIAGNDPNAVAPALKQAAQRGIKVVGMDSDVAPDARSVFVNQVTTKLVGENQVESIAKQIDNKGQIAILSATANATNQNAWIKVMKDTLKQPKYKDIKLVKVAYGDDDDQKSFQQMQGLIQAYPNLKGVISPTTVGVAAAARYLSTSPEKGKVKLTGLGFPNQMRKFVQNGTVDEFQLWVPKDVGYLAGQAAAALASGRITGKQGETFTAGRLGKYTIGENGEIVLGPLTTFNKENISKFDF